MFEIYHTISAVQFDDAALLKQHLQLLSAALDARLHAGQREPQPVGGLFLRESLQFNQSHRLTILRLQPFNHRPEATGQFQPCHRLRLLKRVRMNRRHVLRRPARQLPATAGRPVVVDQDVPGDLKYPGDEPIRIF